MDNEDPWLSAAVVAKRLGVSPQQVRALIHSRSLKGRRFSASSRGWWKVRESELKAYMDAAESLAA
jgi:excisionase family DNA binding protein